MAVVRTVSSPLALAARSVAAAGVSASCDDQNRLPTRLFDHVLPEGLCCGVPDKTIGRRRRNPDIHPNRPFILSREAGASIQILIKW